MSTHVEDPTLDSCGCCGTAPLEMPRGSAPGQPALRYRIGTHATFLRRMVARLHAPLLPDGPTMAGLTTRASDDPAIALLDAWATVADVLSFYQERIANEGYLRTATERRSVLELARTIGYELTPGLAASTYLAFTVEDAPGAPPVVTVPQGTRVQSVPTQGQLPQVFETGHEIEARAEWNTLRPRASRPQDLAIYQDQLMLLDPDDTLPLDDPQVHEIPLEELYLLRADAALGQTTDLAAVEVQRIYLQGTNHRLQAGDRLLLVGKKGGNGEVKTLVRSLQRVEVDTERDHTRLDLAEEPPAVERIAARRQRYRWADMPQGMVALDQQIVQKMVKGHSWRSRDLRALIEHNRWNLEDLRRQAAAAPEAALPPADQGVFVFRQQVRFFGHNAPMHETLPAPENTRGPDPYPVGWDGTSARGIWTNSQGTPYSEADAYLERGVPEVVAGSWALFEAAGGTLRTYRVREVSEVSLVDYGLSARSTAVTLTGADGDSPPDKPSSLRVRRTTAYVQSEGLPLAEVPLEAPLPVGASEIVLDRLVLGLREGQYVALSGELSLSAGVTRQEVHPLAEIIQHRGHTVLQLQEGLQRAYDRRTVTLNANVARATHGETVEEVLGSGDGSQPNQRFKLKKPPLTYLSAATTSGGQSTLAIRVNGVLWEEAPSLYGLQPRSEQYIVRIEDDGTTAVTFGDGQSGARLPSGVENVSATYRSGIGPAGQVEAGSLTLLKTRPPGIRGVTNPLPAVDAAAREILDKARTSAPLTVMTLDRIVSRRDFEDFARRFAGIGKALAADLWDGEAHLLHLTVASDSGSPLAPNSDLRRNLIQAIRSVCDPAQRFRVDDYERRLFNLAARVRVDARYVTADVMAEVRSQLSDSFCFENRDLGQPVSAAEVMDRIGRVAGVVAVDLDRLYLSTDPQGSTQTMPDPFLAAAGPSWDPEAKTVHAAQLLSINPAGITLLVMEEPA